MLARSSIATAVVAMLLFSSGSPQSGVPSDSADSASAARIANFIKLGYHLYAIDTTAGCVNKNETNIYVI